MATTTRTLPMADGVTRQHHALVLQYQRYFMKCAYALVRRGQISVSDVPDVVSAINVCVLREVSRYDPTLGAFTTFITPYVRRECQEYVLRHGYAVRLYRRHMQQYWRATRWMREHGGTVTSAVEVAVQAGVPVTVAEQVWSEQSPAVTLSLDVSVSSTEDTTTWVELLRDMTTASSYDLCVQQRSAGLLAALLAECAGRDQAIVCGLYHEELTLREVAARHGISAERVRQRHAVVLAMLRVKLAQYHIRSVRDVLAE